MQKFKVLVTRKWPDSVEHRLSEKFDATLNLTDVPLDEEQLKEAMLNYDALLPTVTDKISNSILSVENKRVRIVGNFGVGFNNIDIDSAKNNGIVVTNTPEVLTDCTADIAMLLMLGIARRASEGEPHVRNTEWTGWRPTHMMGTKVTGKVLGLVGMGRIAQAMAKKAHFGFGMKIVFFDPYFKNKEIIEKFSAISSNSIEDLLSESDFVSLHCPSTPETQGLINTEMLEKMKPSAYLINTARGDIVVEEDLIKALENNQIKGAGLDVYLNEPSVPDKLKNLKNVFLLPHLGSATEETRKAMGFRVYDNIEAFFNDNEPLDRVV